LDRQAEVYRNDAFRGLKALAKRNLQFDLVFMDPPYRLKNVEEWMDFMQVNQLLNPQAVIVVEHDASHTYAEAVGQLQKEKHAVYGDTAVSVYVFKSKDQKEGTGDEPDK
jgi:16S rRNA (guanine966-N2)-methyltransferase